MKRWWVRLILTYWLAGYVGFYLLTFVWVGLTRQVHGALLITGGAAEHVKVLLYAFIWPILLVASVFVHGLLLVRVLAWPCFIGPFVLIYWLLGRWLGKRIPAGHCCGCGYDLRATPEADGPLLERCPECGTEAHASVTSG